MTSHIIPKENLAEFIFGGFAFFTVVSESGNRLTFRIKHGNVKGTNKLDRETPLFVSVLTGGNNESDYSFIGFVGKDGSFVYSRKSKITEEATSVKVISKLIEIITKGKAPNNATIYHEGKCGVCGKKLTVPSSIITGIGPTCAMNSLDASDIRKRKIVYLLNS